MPDFTRISWVSDTARAVWQPRISRITEAWMDVEWRAAAEGVRACGLQTVSPEQFLTQGAKWAANLNHFEAISQIAIELFVVTF